MVAGSPFDQALADADDIIRSVMGVDIYINGASTPIKGVFDNPAGVIPVPSGGAVLEEFSPTLFVHSADVAGIRRRDSILILGTPFWVTRVGEDDGGSRILYLEAGDPAPDRTYR